VEETGLVRRVGDNASQSFDAAFAEMRSLVGRVSTADELLARLQEVVDSDLASLCALLEGYDSFDTLAFLRLQCGPWDFGNVRESESTVAASQSAQDIVALALLGLVVATIAALASGRRFRPPDGAFPTNGDRRIDGGILGYAQAFRAFSSNAKLLLYRTGIGSLAFPTWEVLFNLYLLSVGFDIRLVGAMLFWNWLLHGALAFPAGLISDRYGRRLTYLVSNSFLIAFTLGKLFTLDPAALAVPFAPGGAGGGGARVALT